VTTIYKFPLKLAALQQVEMPAESKILCVQIQRGVPCLWAVVERGAINQWSRTIRMVGTGREAPGDADEYLGTIQIDDGALVLHAFLVK
jgi:hypothetical protein